MREGKAGEGGDRLIDVAHTPGEMRRTSVAVVIDVLRATTTAVTALSRGYASVMCCADLETARSLRQPGRDLAGERHCRPVPGFDYGNSPRELPDGAGRELVLCTSNGSGAIAAAALLADDVILAALINLDAVVGVLPADRDVTVVCSGTDGRYALEDVYVAGRIVASLTGRRTDAALAAECLAAAYGDPREPLALSSNAKVLVESGQTADIDFCARESVNDVVPRVVDSRGAIATVVDPTRVPTARRDAVGMPVAEGLPSAP
jgi:2-phosphosulfolactate phosphatase